MGSVIPPEYRYLYEQGKKVAQGQPIDDPSKVVSILDSKGITGAGRDLAMEQLSQRSTDPFSAMIREAALSTIRRERAGSRRMSFVTGPRGLEGPMSNLIFGGGTSLLGS